MANSAINRMIAAPAMAAIIMIVFVDNGILVTSFKVYTFLYRRPSLLY